MNAEDLKRVTSFATKRNEIYIHIEYLSAFFSVTSWESSMYAKPKERVIDLLINDDDLFKHLITLIERGVQKYKINIFNSFCDILYKHDITLDEIVNDLTLSTSSQSRKKLKKILYITTSKIHKKKVLNRNLFFGLTYKDIIYVLSKKHSDFLTWLKSDKEFNGHDIYNAIENINLETFAKDILNDNEYDNLKQNLAYIKKEYEPDQEVERFAPFRGQVDNFILDPTIIEEIKKGMPEHFNDIQKAYYGYRRICDLFTYNEDYFIHKSYDVFNDIDRLNHIKIGDYIVCNEATMIFAKFLDSLNIPFSIINYDNETDSVYKNHLRLLFLANDAVVFADLGDGAAKSDIAFSKFYDYVHSFGPFGENENTIERVLRDIKEVNEFYVNNCKDLKQKRCREALRKLEAESKAHKMDDLNDEQRINKLLSYISLFEYNAMNLFQVIDDLSSYIFGRDKTCHDMEIIINNQPYEGENTRLVLCVTTNKNGMFSEPENNDYYIFSMGKLKEVLSLEEIKERFKTGEFEFSSEKRLIPGVDNPKEKAK